jgi:hypothetical protein
MEMRYDRIGKIALLAAISNETEERQLKQEINHECSDLGVMHL